MKYEKNLEEINSLPSFYIVGPLQINLGKPNFSINRFVNSMVAYYYINVHIVFSYCFISVDNIK